MGAEDLSMNVAYPGAEKSRASGYEKIMTHSNSTGGVVRRNDKVSFSRVYDARHAGTYIPAFIKCDRLTFHSWHLPARDCVRHIHALNIRH